MKETTEFNDFASANSESSPFDALDEFNNNAARRMSPTKLLTLNHTGMEQRLYDLMFAETRKAGTDRGVFPARELMIQTGMHNYSSLRRAQNGLINKMSIEPQQPTGEIVTYMVYSPAEILERRRKAGFVTKSSKRRGGESENSSWQEIERLVQQHSLSWRQAQVALKCAEGLSNAEIGSKLLIRQETVKFHLTNIFVKFGVKRRAELIAYLFRRELTGLTGRN